MAQEASSVSEALALVLANVIWLLVTFIGEDIALGLVEEVWPSAEKLAASKKGKDKWVRTEK
jgi:hypothetical protein